MPNKAKYKTQQQQQTAIMEIFFIKAIATTNHSESNDCINFTWKLNEIWFKLIWKCLKDICRNNNRNGKKERIYTIQNKHTPTHSQNRIQVAFWELWIDVQQRRWTGTKTKKAWTFFVFLAFLIRLACSIRNMGKLYELYADYCYETICVVIRYCGLTEISD